MMTINLSCTDIEIRGFKKFWGQEFDLLGWRDVIGHMTIKLGVSTFLLIVNDDHMRLSCKGTEIRGFKDLVVTSLTFWGHVTSSVTWLLDSAYVVSYWWSVVTMHLSSTVTEIWGPKDIEVTTLIFWGDVTLLVTWLSDSASAISYWWSMMTMRLSCTYTEIRGFKYFGAHEFDF